MAKLTQCNDAVCSGDVQYCRVMLPYVNIQTADWHGACCPMWATGL